ncbi:phosphotransferase [Alkalihalobacillus hwajinpoensis]|uniref:serine/threonine protein kinase n=1 Tax=Guptibacillus hwajinpoensis TaxID=208199 RepID=UPI0018835299|nr:phosphotransferase [Pseudalkalibacillus hwajinpoensis]MBF0709596.1 phosphotransferase [Pseudalkalibacillus hwajinpoensis]
MTGTSKNQAANVPRGTRIRGKWNQQSYQIMRKLGSGALGTVYLADSAKGRVALKLGTDSMSITSEVNVLKQLSVVQGTVLGPFFYEVDDWEINGKRYPFYVMEYIDGEPLFTFIERRGKEWIGILMLQLLRDLSALHKEGWVFGDLKPDNLLVEGSPPTMRWLDVGGTTSMGRSVKEFTEFFDRGYWGLGNRVAEPSYDLFSVAMIVMNAAYPKRFDRPKKDSESYLLNKIEQSHLLREYKPILRKALLGKYIHAQDMRQELFSLLQGDKSKVRKRPEAPSNSRVASRQKPPKRVKQKGSKWIETVLIVAFLLFFYTLYLVGHVF